MSPVTSPRPNRNIFVAGDLVIDHDRFLTDHPRLPHQVRRGEHSDEAVRRLDTAGGAANTARILAVLNEGPTYLWGVVGDSPWGSFREILERSQALDGAKRFVEFRAVRDERDETMNTVNREIVARGDPPSYDDLWCKGRILDGPRLWIPESKRLTLLEELRAVQRQRPLDAIILNDLDLGALTPTLVAGIAKFASSQDPPVKLFVDPKWNRAKYEDIDGVAILPNLAEWCSLVGERVEEEMEWRNRILNPAGLQTMARRSVEALGTFACHVVKCEDKGTILVTTRRMEHGGRSTRCAYRIKPRETLRRNPLDQVGCGDVMTGVFALLFPGTDDDIDGVLLSLRKASSAVGCYREMDWRRMPARDDVLGAWKDVELEDESAWLEQTLEF